MDLFKLDGRTAIVTGGSRGIGLQIAEALGELGAQVILIARKRDELAAAVAHLASCGIRADAIAADLAAEDGPGALVEQALALSPAIDILVNNAGATWGAAAEDYPLEAWDKVMNLNVRAAFRLCQVIGRASMIPRRRGRIVTVASVAGLRGNRPGFMQTIAYNTSKGALVNFTRTLAGEWGKYGITVNALAPYVFPTKMTRGLIEERGTEALVKEVPLGRFGGDDDLKGAAALLSSDAGAYITGQILAVDGGVSAV